jgi:hypothetical protein
MCFTSVFDFFIEFLLQLFYRQHKKQLISNRFPSFAQFTIAAIESPAFGGKKERRKRREKGREKIASKSN